MLTGDGYCSDFKDESDAVYVCNSISMRVFILKLTINVRIKTVVWLKLFVCSNCKF